MRGYQAEAPTGRSGSTTASPGRAAGAGGAEEGVADLHGGRQRRPLRRGPGHGLMERADFAAWCAAVCRHIRYRPAHAQAAAELMDHLTDHAAALEDAGAAPEEAARTALAAMGTPGRWGWPWTGPIRPLLCASVALTRACAVLLSVAACLFLLPAPVPERLGSADLPAGEEHPRRRSSAPPRGTRRRASATRWWWSPMWCRPGMGPSPCACWSSMSPPSSTASAFTASRSGMGPGGSIWAADRARELFPPQHRLLPGLSAHGQRDPPSTMSPAAPANSPSRWRRWGHEPARQVVAEPAPHPGPELGPPFLYLQLFHPGGGLPGPPKPPPTTVPPPWPMWRRTAERAGFWPDTWTPGPLSPSPAGALGPSAAGPP